MNLPPSLLMVTLLTTPPFVTIPILTSPSATIILPTSWPAEPTFSVISPPLTNSSSALLAPAPTLMPPIILELAANCNLLP